MKLISIIFIYLFSVNTFAKKGGVYLEPSITYTSINLEGPTSSPIGFN